MTTQRTRLQVEQLESRYTPSTLTVTSLADAGPGTLRQAIVQNNTDHGGDVINFATGMSGTIPVGKTMTILYPIDIEGPGGGQVVLDGSIQGLDQQFFATPVHSPVSSVAIDGLTMQNATAIPYVAYGAAVGDWDGNSLTLDNDAFINCHGNGGGAVFAGGTGTVVALANDTFTDCVSAEFKGGYGWGGAVAVRDMGGSVTLTNCMFTGNQAFGAGGALWVYSYSNTPVTITGCTFQGNQSQSSGGAVYDWNTYQPGLAGQVNTQGNSYLNNTAAVDGGAVWFSEVNVTMNQEFFQGNRVPAGDSNDVYVKGYDQVYTTLIENSTLGFVPYNEYPKTDIVTLINDTITGM